MTDINFDCPHCNQNLEAPPDMARETIECPTCEESIEIPAPQKSTQVQGKKIVMKKRTPSPSSNQSPPAQAQPALAPSSETTTAQANASEKSRLTALLLCFFLGGIGVHRFYVGKVGTGIVQILTLAGFCGIWVVIDFIMIIVGSFSDKKGRPLQNW